MQRCNPSLKNQHFGAPVVFRNMWVLKWWYSTQKTSAQLVVLQKIFCCIPSFQNVEWWCSTIRDKLFLWNTTVVGFVECNIIIDFVEYHHLATHFVKCHNLTTAFCGITQLCAFCGPTKSIGCFLWNTTSALYSTFLCCCFRMKKDVKRSSSMWSLQVCEVYRTRGSGCPFFGFRQKRLLHSDNYVCAIKQNTKETLRASLLHSHNLSLCNNLF